MTVYTNPGPLGGVNVSYGLAIRFCIQSFMFLRSRGCFQLVQCIRDFDLSQGCVVEYDI